MATEFGPNLAELDEVLSKAIDRQIAEQRALRQALEDLRDAVRHVAERGGGQAPPIDVIGLSDTVRDSVRLSIDTGIGRIEKSLRDTRGEVVPVVEQSMRMLETVRDDTRIGSELVRNDAKSIADVLGTVAADVRGMAQALIDLNAGLRGWADGVDVSLTGIRQAVDKMGDKVGEASTPPDLKAIQEQVKETADLSLYLTDQIEDLDAVLNKLGELPANIEGVVTQAMRRTLTARAKIEQEASSVLDDVASSLDGTVDRLAEALDVLEGGDVRRLALAQVELSSRLESMHDTLQERIEDMEIESRQMLEALARAIDRSARGQDPHALETVAKASVPPRAAAKRRSSGSGKSAKPKAAKRKPTKRTTTPPEAGT